MQAISTEEKEITTPFKEIIVTTHRVQTRSINVYGSIPVEEISFCGVERTSRFRYLIIAFLSLMTSAGVWVVLGAKERDLGVIGIGVVTAVIFILLYFLTRRTYVQISSSGGSIRIRKGGMRAAQVQEGIDQIEKARLERLSRP